MRASLKVMVVASVVLAGCGRATREKAEAATAAFHGQLQRGAAAEIYGNATPEFRANISEPDFERLVAKLNEKLGTWRSSEPQGWNVNFGTNGKIVTLSYSSAFDRAKATEQFVWRMEGDRAVLLRYNFNSNALLLN